MAETRKHVRTPKKQANKKQQDYKNKFNNQTNKKRLRMPTIRRKTRRRKKNENRRTKKETNATLTLQSQEDTTNKRVRSQ